MKTSTKTTLNLKVIELEKADTRPQATEKELRGHILSLQNHPGFEELLRRARVTRAILESRLKRPEEDENRHYLRAAIEAYGFLERQLRTEIGRPVETAREAYEDERLEYERLAKYVEIIGRTSEAN